MGEATVEDAGEILTALKTQRQDKSPQSEPWWKRNPFKKSVVSSEPTVEKLPTSGKPLEFPVTVNPDGSPKKPIPHPDAIPDNRITAGGPARVEPEGESNHQDTDNGLDEIGTGDKIVSPPLQQGTADNVTPINENVVVPPTDISEARS